MKFLDPLLRHNSNKVQEGCSVDNDEKDDNKTNIGAQYQYHSTTINSDIFIDKDAHIIGRGFSLCVGQKFPTTTTSINHRIRLIDSDNTIQYSNVT